MSLRLLLLAGRVNGFGVVRRFTEERVPTMWWLKKLKSPILTAREIVSATEHDGRIKLSKGISISMDREAGQCLSRSLRRFSRRQVGPRVSVRRQAIEPIPIDLDRGCAPRIRQVAVGLGEVGEQAFATVNKGALAKRCKAGLEIGKASCRERV